MGLYGLQALLDQLQAIILQMSGVVSVSNFPATQAVSISSLPSIAVSNFPAIQPISVASLPTAPVQQSSTATVSVSQIITTASVKIIDANANRKGLILYNNSANSVYLAMGSAANSNTNMTFILATFAQLVLPQPIYTGAIYGIRNAGTGTVLSTELT